MEAWLDREKEISFSPKFNEQQSLEKGSPSFPTRLTEKKGQERGKRAIKLSNPAFQSADYKITGEESKLHCFKRIFHIVGERKGEKITLCYNDSSGSDHELLHGLGLVRARAYCQLER